MIAELSQLSGQSSTVLLLFLLIAAFIVAFKVMKMVFETVMVSVLSGVFYIALAVLFLDKAPTINDTLLFAFLGSAFYMGYSFLVSAYSIGAKIVAVPYHIIKILLKPLGWLYSEIKEKWKLKRIRSKLEKGGKDFSPEKEEEGKSTKDVVLDKVRQDKEND